MKNLTWKKMRKKVDLVSEILEWIINVIVFIAIVIAIISLWEPFLDFVANRNADGAFLGFLGKIFIVVIGIEFFKMLCRPSADTVLEVLMFVLARHMIIEHTTVWENLITIVGIAAVFLIRKYLHTPKMKQEEAEEEKNLKM